MLAKQYRFIGKDALQPVFSKGKRSRGWNLQVRYLPTHRETNRFAVIISKKVAKRAVTRNRIRRRIYSVLEAYRKTNPTHDVAIIVYDADFATIKRSQLEQYVRDALKPIFHS